MSDKSNLVNLSQCPHHLPENWVPPVPAFSAKKDSEAIVSSLYVGVQNPDESILWAINKVFALSPEVRVEYAKFVDRDGQSNRVFIVYFDAVLSMTDWRKKVGLDDFLSEKSHLTADYGLWVESYTFQGGQHETLFSSPDSLEGSGCLAKTTVGPVREHGYWGSTKDRIPNAVEDKFETSIEASLEEILLKTKGADVSLRGFENFCLIRSGQDLREVEGEEKKEYESSIEPALRDGLEFLGKNPNAGCFESRYMQHCTQHGDPIRKTFGMQLFVSIDHMLEWAKSHPTHLAIFGRFQNMAMQLHGQLNIRLWHEVGVMKAGDVQARYINCSAKTGLLPFAKFLKNQRENTDVRSV